MNHLIDFDSYSTKQSNYFQYEDSPSHLNLFSSHLKTKPQMDSIVYPRKKSFKDEMKVEFSQQKRNSGDINQIDPITMRSKSLISHEKPLEFDFNSIDFSKPYPLVNLETLTRELTEEMRKGGSQGVTEGLEYTSSKDIVSFSVSPMTTNLSDRRVTKLTTIEAGDFQTIHSEDEGELSPKFNINNNIHSNNMNNRNSYSNNDDSSNYSNNGKSAEIESFIGSSNYKKEKERLNKTENDIGIQKKLIFETEDEIFNKPLILHRKKKEKQFSFSESNKNLNSYEIRAEETVQQTPSEEKHENFHHVYQNILNKLFNEKNISSTNKNYQNNVSHNNLTHNNNNNVIHNNVLHNNVTHNNVPHKKNNNFSEKINKKNNKVNSGSRTKTEKKLNKREMTSYIEKIMTEAHRFKENKENSLNAAIINFNSHNNSNDFRKKTNDFNKKVQIQNTIIITNNSKGNNQGNDYSPRELYGPGHNNKQSNVFHLDISDVPVLIPLKASGTSSKKSRRFSTFLY